MVLRYPILLLLFLLVPLMVWLRYRKKQRVSIRYSDGETLAKLTTSWTIWANKLLPVFYCLGLCFLIIALARPQKGLEESSISTEVVDIVLLVDLSTSMRALDFSTRNKNINRLDAAKEVIETFIKKRETDRIGMVAFAAMPYTIAPLTLDHGWLLKQKDRLITGMLEDGTAIGDALASAINRIRESKAKSKVVILLTDGVNNRGTLSPLDAAQAAKALDIKIYTVGAGREGLVPFEVQDPFRGKHIQRRHSEIDEETLKRIAEITEARFFRAKDARGLEKVYDEIDQLEKTEIRVEEYTRFEEIFQPFAAIALFFLMLEKILSLSRIGRLT